ncbi:MAG: hypothetical protein JST91_12235 [Actinobacteria bacterium]|nr:hypothetical protein [Actinomycetota bacterium]
MIGVARYATLFVPMLWVGMLVGISFLEAPLRFRAPGVTLTIGLGIGRLVFRALNAAEVALLAVLVGAVLVTRPDAPAGVLLAATAGVLVVQLVGVRPPLNRRSDRVLAGEQLPRSKPHLAYVGLEVVKVVLLVALSIVLAGQALR